VDEGHINAGMLQLECMPVAADDGQGQGCNNCSDMRSGRPEMATHASFGLDLERALVSCSDHDKQLNRCSAA